MGTGSRRESLPSRNVRFLELLPDSTQAGGVDVEPVQRVGPQLERGVAGVGHDPPVVETDGGDVVGQQLEAPLDHAGGQRALPRSRLTRQKHRSRAVGDGAGVDREHAPLLQDRAEDRAVDEQADLLLITLRVRCDGHLPAITRQERGDVGHHQPEAPRRNLVEHALDDGVVQRVDHHPPPDHDVRWPCSLRKLGQLDLRRHRDAEHLVGEIRPRHGRRLLSPPHAIPPRVRAVRVSRRLRGFGRLSRADQLLIIESTMWLARARLAVLLLPFRYVARHMGEAQGFTTADPMLPGGHRRLATRVGWAVGVSSRRTPWKTPCLVEAIAAQRMLTRRHLPSVLHLGLTKEGGTMTAHAWLQCGELMLTGGGPVPEYTPVASFVNRAGV